MAFAFCASVVLLTLFIFGTRAVAQSVNVGASVSHTCGNGVVDSGEQCDGSSLNGQTCVSRGFSEGMLSCNSNCTFNTTQCTSVSSGGGSGGGGGTGYGGGGGYAAPVYTPAATSITSVSGGASATLPALQAQLLNLLITQLQILLRQAQAQGIAFPAGAAQFLPSASSTTSFSFENNLGFGAVGSDVSALQHALNARGFTVAASGPGSPGNETTYFGPATRNALIAFQKSVGISPARGYFGPISRAYINSHP